MNISFETPDKINGLMTITVEEADYKENVEKTLKEYRKRANLPGFRPGMVPMGLIKRQYGTSVKMEAINKFVGEQIYKYVKDNNIQMLGEPLPNLDAEAVDLEHEAPYTFKFDIAVAPEFDAKLTGKNKLTEYVIEVTDEMVNNQIQSYCERFGEYSQAEEIAEGDIVKGIAKQVDGEIVKEGAILNPAYMKQKTQQKKFIGAKKGDVVTFNPTKAYGSSAERGAVHQGLRRERAERRG